MRPRSFRNSDHSSFLFLLILGIIKIPFVSFQGSNGRLRPCGVVWQLPILGMCQGVNVSFSPSGVVNYHESLFLRSDFATFGFRRWRDVLSPHRKINSAMLFSSKGCPNRPPLSKDAVKHRSLYLKPVSQSATVVLQNCDDEVMKRYPIFNLPSHFTMADDFAHCTRLEMGRVFSPQPPPWIRAVVNTFTVGILWNKVHRGRPETRRPLKKLRWYFTE